MKRLLLFFLFCGSLDGFGQVKDTLYLWPDGKLSVLNPGPFKTRHPARDADRLLRQWPGDPAYQERVCGV